MKKIVSINPATGEVNEEFELYSEDRGNEVIKKAKAAFLEWKNLDICDRADYLMNAAKVLRRIVRIREIVAGDMNIPIFSRNSCIFGSDTFEAGLSVMIKHFTPLPNSPSIP